MTSFFKSTRWRTYGLWLMPLLLLVLSAARPLSLPDEGRYAEVARWMWMTGDWLTPRIVGIPFFHKPPLLYWFEAVSIAVWGATPWAARFVVALHACLMLGVTFVCARAVAGDVVARRASWILACSMTFLAAGQYVNHDMVVASWMSSAIWCFARAFTQPSGVHAGWARAGFIACALGVMSKGLIGLLLPGLVLFVWIAVTVQWRKILQLPWFSGLALFALIALPWFVLAAREHPDMLAYMFGKHQFGRYTATTFNNSRPWWFYGVAVTVLLFPWIFFVIADGLHRLRHWTQQEDKSVATLCWIWVLAILIFFSIPNSKLMGYALPVVPALAVLAAVYWQRSVVAWRWASAAFATLCVVGISVAAVANHLAGKYTLQRSAQGVAEALVCLVAPSDVVAVVDDFPYDLLFYAKREQPIEVIQHWEREQEQAGDDWRRELMDGVAFDKKSGDVLKPYSRLAELKTQPNAWVLAPRWLPAFSEAPYAGLQEIYRDQAWILYRGVNPNSSLSIASKSPEATEQKSLGRCKN